ncbi:hypothetical protein BWI75_05510 [Gloeocapsopsis sp. AAB1 = 1H9]|uniref:Uncharacterized protein n=2 Tax=Gloeocapsopsis TaxID=693222 RepID=A0A6N8FTC7_9CHRO|nr:hypothetical protein [Gloeocapsopsis dulcis AAB1 = 1H9]
MPAEYASQITSSMDPFVVAAIYVGMTTGADLRIHGEVSPSLIQNLEEFQTIWKCWRPKIYTNKIQIIADIEREQLIAKDVAGDVMAFSGGVDSSFTAFSHIHKLRGRLNRNIKAGVLIQSSVPPFASNDLFKHPYNNLAVMLANFGVNLIPMTTNAYKDLRSNRLRDHFTPVAISCLMLFQGTYRAGLLASTEPYDALVTPWVTHPLTDPLLSSNSFKLIHDGAEFNRTQKVGYLANFPEALSVLQVCWWKDRGEKNCGKCSKCIRTILNFRTVKAALPTCFEQDASDLQILRLSLENMNQAMLNELELILSDAQKASISDSWVLALKICIWITRLRIRVLSPIKQSLLKLLNAVRLSPDFKQKQFKPGQLSNKAGV